MRKKKDFHWSILIAVPILAILLMVITGELFFTFRYKKNRLYQSDSEIGWVPKKNFTWSRVQSDIAGSKYNVKVSTNKYGFRAWGDETSNKAKILFIGDSFTGDPNMSDEDAYYGQVKKFLNVEVFALGGGGYGTLQELMILKKYASIINPDYFVLQFCSNDFSNNSLDIEGKCIVRNQKNLRPYFVDDKVTFRNAGFYRYLYRNMNLFKFLDGRLQIIQFNMYDGYRPATQKDTQEETLASIKVTETLLKMMADSVPKKTKLLTFTCSTKNKYKNETEDWIRVSKEAGFIPLPIISKSVEKNEEKGAIVRAADGGHWSPKGHHIAGKALAKELKHIMEQDL